MPPTAFCFPIRGISAPIDSSCHPELHDELVLAIQRHRIEKTVVEHFGGLLTPTSWYKVRIFGAKMPQKPCECYRHLMSGVFTM